MNLVLNTKEVPQRLPHFIIHFQMTLRFVHVGSHLLIERINNGLIELSGFELFPGVEEIDAVFAQTKIVFIAGRIAD